MNIVLFISTSLLLVCYIDGQQQWPWTASDCQKMSRACHPLPKGAKGFTGEAGSPGRRGPPGNPGRQGQPGARGPNGGLSSPEPPGPKPARGETGQPGLRGSKGDQGEIGSKGIKGQKARDRFFGTKSQKGRRGQTGVTGDRGLPGDTAPPWATCVWRIDTRQDDGLIEECTFFKRHQLTSLHVVYEGSLEVGLCMRCCKRWFFTFNSVECSRPTVIDAFMSGGMRKDYPHHTYGRIEGLCEDPLSPGQVNIALRIENCPGIPGTSQPVDINLYNPVGKLLIREVTPSQ